MDAVVNLALLVAVFTSDLSSSQQHPSKIGILDMPWKTVSHYESLVQKLVGRHGSVNVVTIPMETATKSAYTLIENTYQEIESLNLLAVIGPFHRAVALAAEALHVPYLCISEVTSQSRDYTLELSPDMEDIGMAIYDIANTYGWEKISVFYDDDRGVTLMEKLMTNYTMTVRGWRLTPAAKNQEVKDQEVKDQEVKDALVKMRKVFVERTVIICNKNNTANVLKQARNLAMLSTPPYQWLFYDPDHQLHDLLLSFHDIAVNFTVLSVLRFDAPPPHLDLPQALLADALSLVTSAHSAVNTSDDVRNLTATGFREEVNRVLRERNETVGKTGQLSFTADGERDNFTFFVTALTGDNHVNTIGKWYSRPVNINDSRLHLQQNPKHSNRSTPFPLKGRNVTVVMIEERPFTMRKRDYIVRKGNDRFHGFAVDLIREVAQMLGFKYQIYLVNDGNFGSKQENGEWNGMIGELLAGNATMSVAPLSINSDREEAVDFTKPFMTRYINVLLRLPKRETFYFEFLNPLSPLVWICTLGSFVVVSIVLYVLERIASSSNSTAAAGSGSGAQRTPKITIRESFWFIFGSLLQGNTDSSPNTIPGRILTSAWWFFALILISSYTANLAAFLTVKKINTPIKSVTDLAQQSKIKYGTVKSSGVMGFFKNTKIEHFAKMWAQMSEIEPDSMVDNTAMGFERVKNDNYAFFWDTTVNKYQTIIDCEFMEIGPPFDPKGFGIGVPPGATYRDDLSMAILKLSDKGTLHELETKYWGSRSCPSDVSKPSSDETSELQIDNVAGVFFILVGGIIIAAVVCLGEYVGHALLRASKTDKGPTKDKCTPHEAFL